MKEYLLPALIISIFFFQSCDKNSSGISCTEVFVTVGVKIIGDSLTTFYTVRNSTSDTIRLEQEAYHNNSWYPILTDKYQKSLTYSQEDFTFIGKINDSTLINEPYTIGADDCHIYLVSGKKEIRL